MSSGSMPARWAGERRGLGPRDALEAGVSVAAVLAAGSLVIGVLLALADRSHGPAAVASPLQLPAASAGPPAASRWGFAFFAAALLPHPLPGTDWWVWGSGSLPLTALIAVLAFRGGAAAAGGVGDVLLAALPPVALGAGVALLEIAGGGPAALLALAPATALLPGLAGAAGAAARELPRAGRALPALRAMMSSLFGLAAGIALAAVPVLLSPAGPLPAGLWALELLPFAPNAIIRAALGGHFGLTALAAIAGFAAGAVLGAVHLRRSSLAERALYAASLCLLLVLAAAAATPATTPATTLLAMLAALPASLAVGVIGAALGPLVEGTRPGHALAAAGVLRALGDRLPPPPAPELTARDMEAPGTPGAAAAPRRAARADRIGRAAVAISLGVALLAVAGVTAATFAPGPAPSPAAAAATAYLQALPSNDAGRIWAAVDVDPSALPDAAQPRLLTRDDLARMLELDANRHPALTAIQSSVAGEEGSATVVRVHYLEAGVRVAETLRVGLRPGGWRVLWSPGAVAVTAPGATQVLVDGAPVALRAGQPLAVLPGTHAVEASYPPPFTGARALVAASDPYPVVVPASVAPELSPGDADAATGAVRSALEACAGSSAAQPAGCPQSIDAPAGTAVRWTLVGDPAGGLAVAPDGRGGIAARGQFQMIGAYAVHIPEDTKHVASAGSFQAALTFTSGAWSVAGPVAAGGGTAVAPPIAAPSALAAVAGGFAQCAASHLLRPADCPQTVPSVYFVKDVAWRLDADPLTGAVVAFDAQRGFTTVTGAYSMSVGYVEGGQPKQAQSSGRYRADLLWDGRQPVLVAINRG